MSNAVKIVAFANDPDEPMLVNFIRSLQKYNYDYKIVGTGVKWENFMTKIKGCLDYIRTLDPTQLIVIVDAYDVLATGPSDELVKKYQSYGKSLVVGSETYCGANCIPVDNWWQSRPQGKIRYANGGFYMGPVSKILQILNFMLVLGIKDDQEALCTYVNTYPEDIALDTGTKLVANITPLDFHYLDFQNGRIQHKLTNEYPCFVHTPGKTGDVMIRTNYVGMHVLGDDYNKTPLPITFNEMVKKIPVFFQKNYKVLLTVIVLLLVLLALILFYNPKILIPLIFLAVIGFILLILSYSRSVSFIV